MGRKVEKITEFSDEVTTYMGSVDEEDVDKPAEEEQDETNPTSDSADPPEEMVASTDSTDRMNEDIDQALAEVCIDYLGMSLLCTALSQNMTLCKTAVVQ